MKTGVAILFGGKSAEHQISLISARNIIENLDQSKYDIYPIAIDQLGSWFYAPQYSELVSQSDPKRPVLQTNTASRLHVLPGQSGGIYIAEPKPQKMDITVVFPILHGPLGEDGSVQGLLRILDLAFVGPDVAASAAGMDKAIMKRLLDSAGIANAPWLEFKSHQKTQIQADQVIAQLGLPLFIKPANMGSSIGISKVQKSIELQPALELAFRFDSKIIIESSIDGREVECAVLGNQKPQASPIGEVVAVKDGWYSYDAKYFDEQGARLDIPAQLESQTVQKLQQVAIECYEALDLEGLSRIDMFLGQDNQIYVNEVNTLPGFTPISMYPKLWELAGLPIGQLLDQLIELALKRHQIRNQLSSQV